MICYLVLFRIMVRNFPVKVCHREETFLMMITASVCFTDIVKEITVRFPCVTCGKYKLRYTIPGHNQCQLISDYDLSMLSTTVEIYELKDVTINVVEDSSTDSWTLQRYHSYSCYHLSIFVFVILELNGARFL